MKRTTKGRSSKKSATRKSPTDVKSVIASLERLASARIRDEMGPRYGVHTNKAFGVPMGAMLKLAKEVGRDHDLALNLWKAGWYEARMVACMVDDPEQVTGSQMDAWCKDFDNWGICDTVCFKLFDQVEAKLAFGKVKKWAKMKGEFQRRGAFALLACVALHNKEVDDKEFLPYIELAAGAAGDERNFVKKGVSWALCAMKRRGPAVRKAVELAATRLSKSSDPNERWVGRDVMKAAKSANRKKANT